LEPIGSYLKDAGYPTQAIISIGATRYTHFGETNFLKEGDEVIVVVYNNDKYCMNPILSLANKGELAEKEQHHPNIYLYGWNKVKITLTTHILHGLSQNDFIMAVKINKIQV